jgi:hypothetical protein
VCGAGMSGLPPLWSLPVGAPTWAWEATEEEEKSRQNVSEMLVDLIHAMKDPKYDAQTRQQLKKLSTKAMGLIRRREWKQATCEKELNALEQELEELAATFQRAV